jgi:hypothetical protein
VQHAAQSMFANIFLFLVHCAREALAEVGRQSAVA